MDIKKHLIKGLVEWSDRDYALFFGFTPLVLILFFVLPVNLQDQIILKPLQPTLISAFFSNYLHTNLEHFESNLLSYFIIMLLLFNIETNKKRFYIAALGVFTIIPLISSSFIILFLSRINPSLGFSAIVAGFLGYFVYDLYAYVKQKYSPRLNYNFLGLLFMLNVFVWSVSWSNSNLILISLIAILWFLHSTIPAIKETLSKVMPRKKPPLKEAFHRSFLIMLPLAVAIFGMYILIPRDVITGQGNSINIMAHFIGYLCGLVLSLSYDMGVRSKND
jgi:hypothetical protein